MSGLVQKISTVVSHGIAGRTFLGVDSLVVAMINKIG
jgi:hypothetical protein